MAYIGGSIREIQKDTPLYIQNPKPYFMRTFITLFIKRNASEKHRNRNFVVCIGKFNSNTAFTQLNFDLLN